MGEDLSLPERTAIRTPMQWSATANAGFSDAPPADLLTPVINAGGSASTAGPSRSRFPPNATTRRRGRRTGP
jgi:hypothetical protein